MTDEIKPSETAAENPPLPLRVLLPRALVAIVIGGLAGKLIASVWVLWLGKWLFPTVFPSGRGMVAGDMSVGLTMIGGALLGLVLVCTRGNKWLRAIATVAGVWLGAIVCFMGVMSSAIFTFFLLTSLPPDNRTPPMTVADYKFSIWSAVPMILSGGAVLWAVFKMHVSDTAVWGKQWRADFAETWTAIFKPQARHQLERFVLQSPLSPEECRARLPQIADLISSPFAFWQRLPLPGLKPFVVYRLFNSWVFTGRYKKSGFNFEVDWEKSENGTLLRAASHLVRSNRYYSLITGSTFLFVSGVMCLIVLGDLFLMLIGKKPLSAEPLFVLLIFGYGFGLFTFITRLSLNIARRQQLQIIKAMQQVFGAQIIERQTVRYKWGLWEEKSPNVAVAGQMNP